MHSAQFIQSRQRLESKKTREIVPFSDNRHYVGIFIGALICMHLTALRGGLLCFKNGYSFLQPVYIQIFSYVEEKLVLYF